MNIAILGSTSGSDLGFLIENPAFYGDLSPRTVLTYFAKLKGYPKEKNQW